MASFDHRSPHRFFVTVVGATSLRMRASSRARRVAAVVLADLEAGGARVGADGVTRLVHAGADEDHAAERILGARHRRHPLVVDTVLEIDDDAVRARAAPAEQAKRKVRRPLGVVRLHGQEDGAEGLVDRLRLVQVQGLHGDDVLATAAAEPQAHALHRLHVLGPLVDEGDVVSGFREQSAHDGANRARAQDPDPHVLSPVPPAVATVTGIVASSCTTAP